ncbi:ArsA family ATPase [bacterium]|nr:ArsA family ATPase [bacterium]
MGLIGLREDRLKLILFGGKGGVGKTTCASGTGLYLSEDFKTLLFSTDPAHSLADSLGQKIGPEIEEVRGIKNLKVLQVSAEAALSKFKLRYESQIKKILDTSTYLDQEDIDSLFALPIPGMDEVMGFKTIVDLIDEAKFDKYIVDTAPTGHALRLLTLPDLLDDWIKVMAKMRWKYRYMEALGMDLFDVCVILENGYNCSGSKRKKNVVERCIDRKRKTYKVVVAKSYNYSREEDIWLLIHAGIFGRR